MSNEQKQLTAEEFVELVGKRVEAASKPSEQDKREWLRDYFAAKAMQGLLDAAMAECEIAKAAYEMADAMLKARQA